MGELLITASGFWLAMFVMSAITFAKGDPDDVDFRLATSTVFFAVFMMFSFAMGMK